MLLFLKIPLPKMLVLTKKIFKTVFSRFYFRLEFFYFLDPPFVKTTSNCLPQKRQDVVELHDRRPTNCCFNKMLNNKSFNNYFLQCLLGGIATGK